MIQSHYFVERMAQERPQELLRVAREIAASRAARESRVARRTQVGRGRVRYDPLAHLLAHGLARVGRGLVSVGRQLQAVQERRERTLTAPLVGSCVVCGDPRSS